ncbi:MAG TPA: hypothetical protein VI790_03810 [Candidatus Nanoarchaeia archaeon]|nr:hypothetical protein [Candidatus Nanoarchaeia archaeon]
MDERTLTEELKKLSNINENYNEIINDHIAGVFHKISLTSFSDVTNNLLGYLKCSVEIKQDKGELLTDGELENTIKSLKTYFKLLSKFEIFAGELLSDGYLPRYDRMSIDNYITMIAILTE